MEAPAFAATIEPMLNYKEDWIIDSGCSNHMTNDDMKLEDMTDYKGRRVVLMAARDYLFLMLGRRSFQGMVLSNSNLRRFIMFLV